MASSQVISLDEKRENKPSALLIIGGTLQEYHHGPDLGYRLVQVLQLSFSPPRMPLAMSSQRVNTWYHSDPHDQRVCF